MKWPSTVAPSISTALKSKYQFVQPPPPIAKKDVPAGRVLVQLAEEGMPDANAWPNEPPKVGESYTEDVFGFLDVPQKYVDTGVRGDRHVPFLFRAAASVTFPKGKHRLLLRARGATNLHIDGKTVLTTPFPPSDSRRSPSRLRAERLPEPRPRLPLRPAGESRIVVRI
jgi:hypothetical protein